MNVDVDIQAELKAELNGGVDKNRGFLALRALLPKK